MRPLHGFAVCALAIVVLAGCQTPRTASRWRSPWLQQAQSNPPSTDDIESSSSIQTASHTESDGGRIDHGPFRGDDSAEVADPDLSDDTVQHADDPLAGVRELSVEYLVSVVQARNPSIQAAQAAWSAAVERYPQAVSLEDPVFQSMFAPASFAANQTSNSSYYLGFAQRVPWYGKRALKGQVAQWEATAMSWDAQEVQLRLAATTRLAFYDYYLVHREIDLNRKNVEVVTDFRSSAKAKYEANLVSQQDLSAADLELAKLQQQQLELDQSLRLSIARINTLLHRAPMDPVPPPPKLLSIDEPAPNANELRVLAIEHRPELAAVAARIQSEQNNLALACKEYYPDFEFMARYDAFWTDKQQRPQVGMNMNVPIRHERLAAAVREAQFRLTRLNAEYLQLKDSVNEEVEIAAAKTETAEKSVRLYESTILPAAETNLEAARATYVAGTIDFLRLLEARRQYIEQQAAYQRVLTSYHRNRADLERAVGTKIVPGTI